MAPSRRKRKQPAKPVNSEELGRALTRLQFEMRGRPIEHYEDADRAEIAALIGPFWDALTDERRTRLDAELRTHGYTDESPFDALVTWARVAVWMVRPSASPERHSGGAAWAVSTMGLPGLGKRR